MRPKGQAQFGGRDLLEAAEGGGAAEGVECIFILEVFLFFMEVELVALAFELLEILLVELFQEEFPLFFSPAEFQLFLLFCFLVASTIQEVLPIVLATPVLLGVFDVCQFSAVLHIDD